MLPSILYPSLPGSGRYGAESRWWKRQLNKDDSIYIHAPTATRLRLGPRVDNPYVDNKNIYKTKPVDNSTAELVPETVDSGDLIYEDVSLRELLLFETKNPSREPFTLKTEGGRSYRVPNVNPYKKISEVEWARIVKGGTRIRYNEFGEEIEVYNLLPAGAYVDVNDQNFNDRILSRWLWLHGYDIDVMGLLSRVSKKFNEVMLNSPENHWRTALFYHYGTAAVICSDPYMRRILDSMTSNVTKRGRRYDKRTLEWLRRVNTPNKLFSEVSFDASLIVLSKDARYLHKVWQCANHVYALFTSAYSRNDGNYLVHWDIEQEIPFEKIPMVVVNRFKPNLLGKGETLIYAQCDMDGFVAILKDSSANTTQTIYVSAINPDAPMLVSQSKFRKPIHRTVIHTHKNESFVEMVTSKDFEKIPLVVMTPDLIYVGNGIIVNRRTLEKTRLFGGTRMRAVVGPNVFIVENNGNFYIMRNPLQDPDRIGKSIENGFAQSKINQGNPFAQYVCHSLKLNEPMVLLSYVGRDQYQFSRKHYYDFNLVSSNLACVLCKTQGAPVKDAKLGHPFCDAICQKKWYKRGSRSDEYK